MAAVPNYDERGFIHSGGVIAPEYPPNDDGYHPHFPHLVLFDIEPHYGMYILTAYGHEGNALISGEDAEDMFGEHFNGGYAYLTDEYLSLLQ